MGVCLLGVLGILFFLHHFRSTCTCVERIVLGHERECIVGTTGLQGSSRSGPFWYEVVRFWYIHGVCVLPAVFHGGLCVSIHQEDFFTQELRSLESLLARRIDSSGDIVSAPLRKLIEQDMNVEVAVVEEASKATNIPESTALQYYREIRCVCVRARACCGVPLAMVSGDAHTSQAGSVLYLRWAAQLRRAAIEQSGAGGRILPVPIPPFPRRAPSAFVTAAVQCHTITPTLSSLKAMPHLFPGTK